MYRKNHFSTEALLAQRRAARKRKKAAVASAFALVGVLLIGGTVAYLVAQTGPVTNTFTPALVDTNVEEELGETKSNVQIENTGDIDAFIRAQVVVSWVDESGNVYAAAPVEGADYTVTWSGLAANGGWFKGADGFYYHAAPVAPGALTSELFTNCAPVAEKTPEGYFLSVEILSSGIQSVPADAAKEAWPAIGVVDGELTARYKLAEDK